MLVRLDSYPEINSMYPKLEEDYAIGDLIPCLVHERVWAHSDDVAHDWFLLPSKSKVSGPYTSEPSYFHKYELLYREPNFPKAYGDYPSFWVRAQHVTLIGDIPQTNREAASLLSPDN